MTKLELHEVLDDENKKITVEEFRDIIYRLKEDCFKELYKLKVDSIKAQWYYGEVNAFFIALDLSEHIKENDEFEKNIITYNVIDCTNNN